jgi:hypothetical protein
MNRSGHHAVSYTFVNHHGAKIADIGHGIGRHLF